MQSSHLSVKLLGDCINLWMYLSSLPVFFLGVPVLLRNFVQGFTYMKNMRVWSKYRILFAHAGAYRRAGLSLLCWLAAGSSGVSMPLDVPLCPGEWWHWWQALVGLVPRIEQLPRAFHGQRERISPCAEPIFIDPKMQGTSSQVCESPAQVVAKIWHVVFNFSTPKFLELNGEGRYHMELRKLWSKYSLKLTRKSRGLLWVLL